MLATRAQRDLREHDDRRGTRSAAPRAAARRPRQRPVAEVWLSSGDGRMLAEIHAQGEVLEQRTEGDQTGRARAAARAPSWTAGAGGGEDQDAGVRRGAFRWSHRNALGYSADAASLAFARAIASLRAVSARLHSSPSSRSSVARPRPGDGDRAAVGSRLRRPRPSERARIPRLRHHRPAAVLAP